MVWSSIARSDMSLRSWIGYRTDRATAVPNSAQIHGNGQHREDNPKESEPTTGKLAEDFDVAASPCYVGDLWYNTYLLFDQSNSTFYPTSRAGIPTRMVDKEKIRAISAFWVYNEAVDDGWREMKLAERAVLLGLDINSVRWNQSFIDRLSPLRNTYNFMLMRTNRA